MAEAALWGLVGGSSLVLGAAVALIHTPSAKVLGLVLGFGSGVLISALAFELTDEAYRLGGADAVAIGLAGGALAFFGGNEALNRRQGARRMSRTGAQSEGPAPALLLGAVLDGIPESVAIGIGLLDGHGVGLALVVAVFISNVPEGLGGAAGMRKGGHSNGHILGVWIAVALVSAIASAVGYGLLEHVSGNLIGLLQAFAAGAVLTMLVETMVPDALRDGGRVTSLLTVLGFATAYLLSTLE
jgi:zinc transporter, ZIP family